MVRTHGWGVSFFEKEKAAQNMVLHGIPGNTYNEISVGAAEGLGRVRTIFLILINNLQIAKARSKDRSLWQLLHGSAATVILRVYAKPVGAAAGCDLLTFNACATTR